MTQVDQVNESSESMVSENGRSMMENDQCMCGHLALNHTEQSGCLVNVPQHAPSMGPGCPCAKFRPKEVYYNGDGLYERCQELEAENARLQQELANAPRVVEAKDVTASMEWWSNERGEWLWFEWDDNFTDIGYERVIVRPKQSREPSNEELIRKLLDGRFKISGFDVPDEAADLIAGELVAKLREYNRIVEGK